MSEGSTLSVPRVVEIRIEEASPVQSSFLYRSGPKEGSSGLGPDSDLNLDVGMFNKVSSHTRLQKGMFGQCSGVYFGFNT